MTTHATAGLPDFISSTATQHQVHRDHQGMTNMPTGTTAGPLLNRFQEELMIQQQHPQQEESTQQPTQPPQNIPLQNLQQVVCYTDASLTLNPLSSQFSTAGLGIFIQNGLLQPTQTIYIKASMLQVHSVFMAEAGALAMAASIIHALGLPQVLFCSDNRILVDYLNSQNQGNSSDWRSTPTPASTLN